MAISAGKQYRVYRNTSIFHQDQVQDKYFERRFDNTGQPFGRLHFQPNFRELKLSASVVISKTGQGKSDSFL